MPQFQEWITPYLAPQRPDQQAFLHHLFPESIDFPFDEGKRVVGGVGSGYPKLALLGFWSLKDPDNYAPRFLDTLEKYLGRQVENEFLLMEDLPALMGISLGTRNHGSGEQIEKWTRQLARWGHFYRQVPAALIFAGYLVRKEIAPEGKLPMPYAIYLILAYGNLDMQYAGQIKDFFVRFRKQPWPGPETELPQTILAIYGLDACFRRCIWEEDQVRAWKAEALSSVLASIEALADRQGRWLMALVYLLGIPTIGLCTTIFFQQLEAQADWQDRWLLLQQAFAFLGGPLTAGLLIVGMILELTGLHPIPLKPPSLAKYFAESLIRRRRRRLGIES